MSYTTEQVEGQIARAIEQVFGSVKVLHDGTDEDIEQVTWFRATFAIAHDHATELLDLNPKSSWRKLTPRHRRVMVLTKGLKRVLERYQDGVKEDHGTRWDKHPSFITCIRVILLWLESVHGIMSQQKGGKVPPRWRSFIKEALDHA